MSVDESSEQRVSRAGALKYMGAGAAIAWAAPMIMTGTAEAATANKTCARNVAATDTACGVCQSQQPCGGSGCTCVIAVTGCCFCHQPQSCDLVVCKNNGNCPPGWNCAYTCCGGKLCVPPCGAAPAVPHRPGQRMTHRAA